MRIDEEGKFLIRIDEEKDKFKPLYGQWLDPVLMRVQELRANSDRGFFYPNREWQLYGSIPTLMWKREWDKDPKLAEKWLENDPVGQQFRICPKDTGRTGQIIIK